MSNNRGLISNLLAFALKALPYIFGTWQGRIIGLAVAGGVTSLTQMWWEPVLRDLWSMAFGRALDIPDVPPSTGWGLVSLGFMPLFLDRLIDGWARLRQKAPKLVAVRHQSMEALSLALTPAVLPLRLAGAEIVLVDIDQSAFYADGVLTSPAAAVRMQKDVVTKLRALLSGNPGAAVAYYGKVHIPLAFLAGHSISTETPINFFELDRHNGSWWAVDADVAGEDLDVHTERGGAAPGAADAVVRISVSYPVSAEDVAEVVPQPFRDWHITLARPRVDAVRTTTQIEAIARAFRAILDEIKADPAAPRRVHVFYSGPVSLAFSLGRQISPTIHPPVFVYNFTAKSVPKYAWAIEVNGAGAAERLVITPAPAAAA